MTKNQQLEDMIRDVLAQDIVCGFSTEELIDELPGEDVNRIWRCLKKLHKEGEVSFEGSSIVEPDIWRLTDYGRVRQECTKEEFTRVLAANRVNRKINDVRSKHTSKESDDKAIKLLTVDHRRVLMDGGELRQAIVLPQDLSFDVLEQDVQNGAHPFRPLLDMTSEQMGSKTTFIRARSMEYALKAVVYLAAKQSALTGLEPEEDYADPGFVDLALYDPLEGYTIPNIIPIIPANEMLFRKEDDMPFGFGDMRMNGIGHTTRPMPYWQAHYASVIILNNTACFFSGDESLSDAIGRVAHSAHHIFVITLEPDYSGVEDDSYDEYELSLDNTAVLRAIVRYNAASFDITSKDDPSYMDLLLEGICKQYHMTIPDNYPRKELLYRLNSAVPDMQAQFLDQLIKREASIRGAGELSMDLLKLLGRLDCRESQELRGWELLDSLYGIENVKKEIRRLVAHMKMNQARRLNGLRAEPIVGACFLGQPGTSKSTCAKALAQILADEKLLANDRFTSISGSNLQAPYVGQTSQRVRSLVRGADVLLIDEAYSLSQSMEYRSPFAAEALAELCLCMSESAQRGGDKLFLFAGYGGESSFDDQNLMRSFLNSNPGIKSRVSAVITFPSYSPKDLGSIFIKICDTDGFKFNESQVPDIRSAVESYFEERVNDPSFGNGREAKTLVSEAMRMHGELFADKRIDEITQEELTTITLEDVQRAIESLRKMELARKGKGAQRISLID